MYYITFQQIEAFLTVSRLQNISLAAEKLCISQPTLSKTLRRFEAGIGYAVFTRTNRGLTLTPQGKYLFDAFESVYTNMETAIRKAKEFGGAAEKTLSINAPMTYDLNRVYDTPKRLIAEYTEKYPDVSVQEHLYDFEDFIQQLEFGSADISFIHEFLVSGIQSIEYRRIAKLPMFVVMSANHPLASYDVLSPEELERYEFASIRYGEHSVDEVKENCKLYGFMPKNIIMFDNFQTWMNYICEHRGISICAKSEDMAGRALKFYPFPKSYYIVAAWNPERITSQLQNFFDMLDEKEFPFNIE